MQEDRRAAAVDVIDMINRRRRDRRGLGLIICVYKCPVGWSYTDWTCANIQRSVGEAVGRRTSCEATAVSRGKRVAAAAAAGLVVCRSVAG